MRTDLMGKRHAARCAFFSPESRGESSQSLVNGGKMIRTKNISESEEQRMNKKIFKRAVAMMMAAVLTVGAALPSSNVLMRRRIQRRFQCMMPMSVLILMKMKW